MPISRSFDKIMLRRVVGVLFAAIGPFVVLATALRYFPSYASFAWEAGTVVGIVGLFLLLGRPIWVPILAILAYAPIMLALTMMFGVSFQCQLYPSMPTSFVCPGGYGDPAYMKALLERSDPPTP